MSFSINTLTIAYLPLLFFFSSLSFSRNSLSLFEFSQFTERNKNFALKGLETFNDWGRYIKIVNYPEGKKKPHEKISKES